MYTIAFTVHAVTVGKHLVNKFVWVLNANSENWFHTKLLPEFMLFNLQSETEQKSITTPFKNKRKISDLIALQKN